ncbi:MAG: hypothetical protein CMG64_05905 [Candidatus Marinimicrobia bacterium]|nr:hypothetical protein [Candidatus Neomarinimicrobiota bacterium]
MKKIKDYYPVILIGFFSVLILLSLHFFGIFSIIETKLYDLRFQINGPKKNFESQVVLVEINDESYRLIPESYPYPRGEIWARAIRNLTDAKAKVIAFDIQFDSKDHTTQTIINNLDSECQDCSFKDGDVELNKAIEYAHDNNTKIVLASKIGYEQTRIPPYYIVKPTQKIMDANPYIGFVDHEVDEIDNVSRRYTIFNSIPADTLKYNSFAVQCALCYYDIDLDSPVVQNIEENTISIGDLEMKPFRKEASFLVDYYGPVSNVWGTFPVYSLSSVIDNNDYDLKDYDEDNDWMDMYVNDDHFLYSRFGEDKSPFKNKIVVIGSSLKEDQDFKETPFFSFMGIENPMPGMEFHANAIQQLIDNNYLHVPTKTLNLTNQSFIYHIFIIIFLVILILFISTKFELLSGILIMISIISLWFSYSMGVFFGDQFWIFKILLDYPLNVNDNKVLIPVFFPIATIVITYGMNLSYKLIVESNNKKFLKESFGAYISTDLIDQMYEEKREPKLGGNPGYHTMLFSDIASFSTFSEKLEAELLLALLNQYLTAMTNILIDNKGTLDKYIGDAIVAFYGAPIEIENHEYRACKTALEMNKELDKLRKKWKKEGDKWPIIVQQMQHRIGINAGNIVVGNMGSEMKLNYTMTGDQVNLTARLESSAKQLGITVQVGENIYNKVKDQFIFRNLGKIIVVGRNQSINVYELMCNIEDIDNNIKKLLAEFHKGLDFYHNQEWDEAIKCFSRANDFEEKYDGRKTNPSLVFIERSEKFKDNPPDKDWDGVYALESK